MKSLLSVLAICLAISFISCGGDDDCGADYIGTWNGAINCSGSNADSISITIGTQMGDTLSVNANGEMFSGVLNGCDLELVPKMHSSAILGDIMITGNLEINNDELVFTQMRAVAGEDETCTFVGGK